MMQRNLSHLDAGLSSDDDLRNCHKIGVYFSEWSSVLGGPDYGPKGFR